MQRIHREYILAGAEMIQTNTYGANRYKLAQYGLEDKTVRSTSGPVKIAREAREEAGLPVFLAGSGRPHWSAARPGWQGHTSGCAPGVSRADRRIAQAGADLLILETFSALNELQEAVHAAQQASALPIIAEMTFTDDCRTLNGETPRDVMRVLADMGVAAVGVNCGVGTAPGSRCDSADGGAGRRHVGRPAQRRVPGAARWPLLLLLHP